MNQSILIFFKQTVPVGFFFIFQMFLLSAQSAPSLSQEEQQWLNKHGEIIFVSQTNYPPFEFINTEKRSDGMSIELARWIATELGFKANFKDMPFQEAQNAILDGSADVLTSFFYSEKRDENFNFTPMIWEVPALIFVLQDRPDIKELKDLQGKTIAMQKGDYAEEYLNSKNIEYEILATDSFEEAAEKVITGKADALIGDKQIVLYNLYKNNKIDELKSVSAPLYTGQNCMATREDSQILQSILNKGMKRAVETGIVVKITEKWLGTTYSEEGSFFGKYLNVILSILIVTIILLLIIGLWNLQLQTLVNKKTSALKRNEHELKTIINTIPDLVWLKDPDGVYQACNREFEKSFNAKEDEIVGKTDYDFVSREQADYFLQHDAIAIKTGIPHISEDRIHYLSDGHQEIMETTKTPIYDEKGDLLGVLGLAHSITERVQSESAIKESENFLSTIIENIPDMVFVKDPVSMQYLRLNKSAEDFFRNYTDNFLGKPGSEFLPDKLAEKVEYLNHKVLKTGKMVQEPNLIIHQASGEERIHHLKIVPVYNSEKNNIIYLLSISKDITEQKQTEKLLYIQKDLGFALSKTESMEEALKEYFIAALKITEITAGGLYLIDPQTGQLDLKEKSQTGLPEDFLKNARSYSPESPQYKLVKKGESLFLSYAEFLQSMGMNTGKERSPEIENRFKALAIIPINLEGKVIGCLNLVSMIKEDFSPFTKHSLEAITSQTVITLERIISNQELNVSRQNFQSLFDSINDFLFILGEDGTIKHCNPTAQVRLGYTYEELTKMHVLDLHPPERQNEAVNILQDMAAGKRADCPIPLYTSDGAFIPVETRIASGHWNGEPAIFGVSRDISERIRAMKERELSEERLQTAIEAIDEGFAIFDNQDKLVFHNAKYTDLFTSLSSHIIKNMSFEELIRLRVRNGDFPEANRDPEKWIQHRLAMHKSAESTLEQRLRDNRWIRVKERKMKDGGTVGFRIDVTEMKRNEERINKALQEKEILLKEIHHRVKNNLQVVTSLLSLQSDKTANKEAKEAFLEAENRVRSMSLVHEVLYQSTNLNEIDLQSYLEKLSEHMHYMFSQKHISILISAGDLKLDIYQAVPCGLIITELITNSLKHAFTDQSDGFLSMEISETSDHTVKAVFKDNGVGIPHSINPKEVDSLGLRLITDLIEDQLEGTWQLIREKGTTWILEWPE